MINRNNKRRLPKRRNPVNQKRTALLRNIVANIPRPIPIRSRYASKGETKFIDILQTGFQGATTGTIFPTAAASFTPATAAVSAGSFCQIPQGDTEYQRIGREVCITSIMLKGQIYLPQGNSVFADPSRILIVQDTQCNGAIPTVNNVLNFTGQTVSINSFNNLENSKRFIILSDTYHDMNTTSSNGVTAGNLTMTQVNIFKKVNIPIMFNTTNINGAITTLTSNNIFAIFINLDGTSYLQCIVRLRYHDK